MFNFDDFDITEAIGSVTDGFVEVVSYLDDGLSAAKQLKDKRDSLRLVKAAEVQEKELIAPTPLSNDYVSPEAGSGGLVDSVHTAQQKEALEKTPVKVSLFGGGDSTMLLLLLGVGAAAVLFTRAAS